MKVRMGIDIGSEGAWAVFVDDKLSYGKIPDSDGELNMHQLTEVLSSNIIYESIDDCNFHVVIEYLHSVYGAGASSNFKFGVNNGLVIAMLQILQLPYTKVAPKKWQKIMWEGVMPVKKPDSKKKNKDGTQKFETDTKATSLLAAKRLFPNESFLTTERSRVPDHNIVDAVLMAEYCRRHF